ncbi:EutN/CcmL family microcompartment protein [Pseudoneobacillus rhizosphaerae]|uniref:Carbon dioxide concentrating mechanism protein CcmL n=1 Tax=Pseudoneobacillus rhizosphaerae TaxID=2880968 RepID=A0A9C7GAP5_9BACI|nr:EutN/CcmL family microcompartment protein [Pseudoneobacillus rhizosphaerae]CAG9608740.1 Carbon dioxide concentrating mechanism protein CcmL [Pseudoneobacillus rhizosphaerae]
MKVARVIGNVVSSIKTPSHNGLKFMVVEPIDIDGKSIGDSFMAVDAAQAGIGDIVLILEEGGAARDILKKPDAAVDAIIVGIIDYLEA